MEALDFKCKCGEKVDAEGWIGDWGSLRVFKEVRGLGLGRTSSVSGCVGLTVHCPACGYHLGYYILSTPAHLCELLDKYTLTSPKPPTLALKSLTSQLSHILSLVSSTQSLFTSLESHLLSFTLSY